MATRSNYQFKEASKFVGSIYVHWDGYPQGHPLDVARFIAGMPLVNGIGGKVELGEVANGAGCMFAQVIAFLKKEPGNVYMVSKDDIGHMCEDYLYTIDVNGTEVTITAFDVWNEKEVFYGTAKRFVETFESAE